MRVLPATHVAAHKADGVADRTHPTCAYPQEPIYNGSGDPYDAANFTCGVPKK
jgi:hypothetical protein